MKLTEDYDMADTTLHHHDSRRGIGGSLKHFFNAIFEGLVAMGENSSRYRRLRALSAMSDAELARRGLKREDIVHHVFADVYYA